MGNDGQEWEVEGAWCTKEVREAQGVAQIGGGFSRPDWG